MDSAHHHRDSGSVSYLEKFTNLAASATITASILILTGWSFDIDFFKALIPGMETTKPLGALGFLSAGLALFLRQPGRNKENSWLRFVGLACAGLTFFIGSMVLLEYGLGIDFGIDRLLYREAVLAEPGPFPGRPIFAISACLMLLSLALMLIQHKSGWIDFFVLAILFVGLIALGSYIYGASRLSHLGPYRAVPLPSALLLILVASGYLSSRPESALLAPIIISSPAGIFTRRLLMVSVLVPFLLSWIQITGEHFGLYGAELGVALLATSNATVFAAFIYWNARWLGQADWQREVEIVERKRAESETRSLNASLEQRVAERTQQLEYERARWQGIVEGMAEEVWSCDAQGKVSVLNLGNATTRGLGIFTDKSAEEIYQDIDFFNTDGSPRSPEKSPLLRSLQGEVVRGEEIMRHRKTGVTRYRQYSSAPTRDVSGAITGAVIVVRDITEQKQAEEGMRRYELLSENSKDIVLFVRREDGHILDANTAAVKAYGYSRDELLELSIRDLRAPNTRNLTDEQMAQADAGGILFETVHLRKDGRTFPVEVSSQGAIIGLERTLISIVRDITDRKQNEEQLRYQAVLLSNVGDAVIASDNQFHITAWNAAAESLYGWKAEEVIGRNGLEVIRTEWPEKDADEMRRAIVEKGRWRGEATQVRRDGTRFPVEVSSIVMRDDDGLITGYVSANRDITERKQAEEQIERSNQKLNEILTSIQDDFYVLDRDWKFTYANRRLTAKLGKEPKDFIGKNIWEMFPKHIGTVSEEHLRAAMEQRDVRRFEINGKYTNAIYRMTVFPSIDGLTVIGTDITEQKQAEEGMRRYELLSQHSRDIILFIRREDGRILDANDAAIKAYGYSRDELLSLPHRRLLARKTRELTASQLVQADTEGILFKTIHKRKDGSTFPVEVSSQGATIGGEKALISIIRDITERKQLEDALRESEQKYTLLFEKSAVPTTLLKLPEVVIVDANEACEELTGYTRQEMFGKNSADLGLLGSRERVEAISQFESQGELVGNEVRLVTKNGEIRIVVFNTSPIKIHGQMYALTTLQDITERKRADESLQRNEAMLRSVLEQMPSGVTVRDAVSGELLVSNPRSREILGDLARTPDQFARYRGHHPDGSLYQTEEWPIFRSIATGEIVRGEEILREQSDGSWVTLSLSSAPVRDAQGKIVMGVGIYDDITELKRAEAQLAYQAELLAQVQDAVIGNDERLRITYWNKAAEKMYGWSEQEALGQETFQLFNTQVSGMTREEALKRFFAIGEYDGEVLHTRKDGTYINVHSRSVALKGAKGEIIGIVTAARDITERKRAEDAVRRSEAMLRSVLEQMPSGVTVRDAHSGVLLLSNTRSHEIMGELVPTADLFTQYRGFHMDGSPYKGEDWPLSRSIETGEIVHAEEINYQRGNEDWITLSINSAPVRDPQGQIVMGVGVFDDITERKQAEERITAALKEKEVLLKEIHHRVKNNLQVISSLLRLQTEGVNDPRVLELFADSQRRVRAMALIHEQLYRSSNLAQINFKDYISNLVNSLRRSYSKAIYNVEFRIDVEDMDIEMDQAMTLGLLVNELVLNSLKHAFPSVSIQTQAGKVWIEANREQSGDLTLVVGDNGIGLPDEIDIEQTTSMGFQLVDTFVSQLRGNLTIQRKPGTVFTITIPARKV